MSLIEHLVELRNRLLKAFLGIAVVTIFTGVVLYHPVFHVLRSPYCQLPVTQRQGGDGCQLVFFGPLDAFFIRLKISLIAGVLFAAPIWLWQLWRFITPGLRRHERRYALSFVGLSSLLFAAGTFVAYLTLRKSLEVLLSFAGDGVTPLLEVTRYLNYVIAMLLIFGVSFEFPLVVIMLNIAGVLSAKRLSHWRRGAIFVVFAFAATVTPSQDPFSMLALALPLCLLYEGSVLFARAHDHRKAKRDLAASYAALADDETSELALADTALGPEDLVGRVNDDELALSDAGADGGGRGRPGGPAGLDIT